MFAVGPLKPRVVECVVQAALRHTAVPRLVAWQLSVVTRTE